MNVITLKTYWGFFLTMLAKYTGINIGKNSLEGIYNYRYCHPNLSSSGQPTQAQFSLIQMAGFDCVINLAPTDSNNSYRSAENCLPDEAGLLASLGLRYVHLPVDFKCPEASQ